ncbi:MAG: COP23 domain-containing protein [Aphanothece sp. CMT-3BRIN-NPC111]|jgi:hypothetical protein|nr:COP23 domain-containing protein [Aphanothece sp. CMT-3BRIN-NPC111]
MKLKNILQVSVATLVAAQVPLVTALTSFAAPTPEFFYCKKRVNDPDGARFVTVAIREDGSETVPLIKWRTQEFSRSGNTPERRCYEVTSRLNNAVRENGGKLSGLYLTVGRVNKRYLVLCYVNNTRSGCNRNNVLFTLSQQNQRSPAQVLASIINYSVNSSVLGSSSSSPIFESGGGNESEALPYVNLEELVDKPTVGSSTSSPNLSPSPDTTIRQEPTNTSDPGFEIGI